MSAAPSNPRHTLRSQLPRAGFKWPDRATLLARERQDVDVRRALRDHGGIASLEAAAAGGNERHNIEQTFVAMFAMARTDAVAGRVDQFDTALDWVADLRGRLSWGDFIDEDIFIDLFLRIGRARQDWHASPREPFNTEEHGPLAHAIDAFNSVVSSDWLDADEELFRGVLPSVVELAREIRIRPRRVGGADADAVTAVPHTQGNHADEEDDANKDIEMGEGEVEEVRERLARTEIEEDEEEDEDVEMEG